MLSFGAIAPLLKKNSILFSFYYRGSQRSCEVEGLFKGKNNEKIFSPKKYFNGLECPAIYKIGKKWYLLYGIDVENGENSIFRYAIADNPFGPYVEPKNNALLPPNQYTCRIIKFSGKLLMYYWLRDYPKGTVRERLALPKEIKILKDGSIKLKNS